MAAEIDKTVIGGPQGEAEITQVETPRGRAGVLAKFQKANPDYQGEPTDEELWGYAGEDYDSVKGAHKKNLEDQAKFGEFLANNPRFGGIVGASYGEGDDKVSVGRAIGRAYGDVLQEDEDFWKGVEENELAQVQSREELEKAQQNFDTLTAPRLEQFAKENNLSEDQIDSILQGLDKMAVAMFMGDIPLDIIDLVHKGLNYDSDIQEAADTGYVEGKGEVVRPALKKLTSDTPIPDMAGGTGAGKNKTRAKKAGGSYYDSMEEVKE